MAKKVTTDELKEQIEGRELPQAAVAAKDLLSTGSTMLDMSLTGKRQGGWVKGTYNHVVGDSGAGKTWFALSAFAEASINPQFDDYQFVYNAPEGGAIMDRAGFFGRRAAERIEEIASATVEELYYDLNHRLDSGIPFICVVDSESALSSKGRKQQHETERKFDEGETTVKPSGSYGTDKPAYHSDHLCEVVLRLKDAGSIMIWISQTRDNIGFGSQFKPKTYSGGHALKFYATYQIWVAVRETLKVKYMNKDRQQGILAQLRVTKNRVTGRQRVTEVPIYHSHGIDDVGSCVDWLIEEGRWRVIKKKGEEGLVLATDLDLKLPLDQLVKKIEQDNLEKQMKIAVQETWQEIENAIRVDRKPRYQ